MTDQEKLYETLGELLYAVAMADGVIQPEEKAALQQLLEDHNWASEIKWSFSYEESKASSVHEMYRKAVSFCQNYGPAPEYLEFIEAMKIIAAAANGTDKNELKVINSFSKDLIEQFQKDIEVTRPM